MKVEARSETPGLPNNNQTSHEPMVTSSEHQSIGNNINQSTENETRPMESNDGQASTSQQADHQAGHNARHVRFQQDVSQQPRQQSVGQQHGFQSSGPYQPGGNYYHGWSQAHGFPTSGQYQGGLATSGQHQGGLQYAGYQERGYQPWTNQEDYHWAGHDQDPNQPGPSGASYSRPWYQSSATNQQPMGTNQQPYYGPPQEQQLWDHFNTYVRPHTSLWDKILPKGPHDWPTRSTGRPSGTNDQEQAQATSSTQPENSPPTYEEATRNDDLSSESSDDNDIANIVMISELETYFDRQLESMDFEDEDFFIVEGMQGNFTKHAFITWKDGVVKFAESILRHALAISIMNKHDCITGRDVLFAISGYEKGLRTVRPVYDPNA